MTGPDAPTSPPLRVLWLIKGLGPGGAEQLLVSTATVADQTRFSFTVAFVRADKTRLVPALESRGVTCVLIGGGHTGRFGWPVRLRALLGSADVVHVHSPLLAGVARLARWTLPRARRPALASTEHNRWPRFGRATRLLNGLTAPLDDQRWAVSEEVRSSMWPSRRPGVDVLVHGIVRDDAAVGDAERAEVRARFGVADDQVVAITVANYRRQKDYPNLLRAARQALDLAPNLVWWIVGQGPLEAEVTALHAELGLGDRVRLLGYRADVTDLLRGADLFCLGSEHEGLPVAIMEAMAAGLPVVSTAVGGVAEAVTAGVTGLLVPPHEPGLLAEAVAALVGEADRRNAYGQAARAASARFDIRRTVAVEQEAYVRLAAARAGRGRSGPARP